MTYEIESDIYTLSRMNILQGKHDFIIIPSDDGTCVYYHEDASDYDGPVASRYELQTIDAYEFIAIFKAISDYKKYHSSQRYLVTQEYIDHMMRASIERYDEPCVIFLISQDDMQSRWRNTLSNKKSIYFENSAIPFYHYIIFEYSEIKRIEMLRSVSENSIFFPCNLEVARKFENDYNSRYKLKDDT